MATTISAQRILDRCDELARCSEAPDHLTRVYLSPQMRAANEWVLGWMREAGMSVCVDAIGNVCGRYEGATPGAGALLLGSHLDTVRDAGKYDGMLGVVSAIECVAALVEQGKRLPFAIEIIGFADEDSGFEPPARRRILLVNAKLEVFHEDGAFGEIPFAVGRKGNLRG